MYAKKIKYKDFNGKDREQTFYFNLTQAELVEMESSKDGGLAAYGKKIIEAENVPEVMRLFKELILMSYGEKSDDGNRFIKEDPVRGRLADEFKQTNAYSELYMEFIRDPEKGAEFFNQVIPAEVREEAEKQAANGALPTEIVKA